MTGLFSLTSLLDEVAAKVIARHHHAMMHNGKLRGNNVTFNHFKHLRDFGMSCPTVKTSLLQEVFSSYIHKKCYSACALRQNQRWFHNFFNVIFREFSSFNHATFFDAVSWKGLQNILPNIFLEFHLKIKRNRQNETFWGNFETLWSLLEND